MGNSIKPNIERAQQTGVCQLSKKGIEQFPSELLKIGPSLRQLDLSGNKIQTLPGSPLTTFKSLKTLHLDNNRIGFLPMEIGELMRLENLYMSNNHLQDLPATLSQLRNLRVVNFSSNQLTAFPTQLGNLKQLEHIDLSHNHITTIPKGVGAIQAIEINLNQNQLNTIDDELASCPRLKVLRLEENCLEIKSFSVRLLKESQVSLLAVDGNVFSMKQFQELDGYDEYLNRYTATKKKMA